MLKPDKPEQIRIRAAQSKSERRRLAEELEKAGMLIDPPKVKGK